MGKGRHAYIPIKMASGVQDITCVFVEVAGSYEKKTLILQCPGMVCSPPVVSKCLGEAHRRLDIIIYITLHYITLQYITLILFFFFSILLVISLLFTFEEFIKQFRPDLVVGSRAQFLRPFSDQDVLMIDFTSWGHLLKI